MATNEVKLTIGGKLRTIGKVVDGDYFLLEKRERKDHRMRKYDGFGMNLRGFKKYVLNKVDEVVVKFTRRDGTVEYYKTTPETWAAEGKKAKEDVDKQIFLPRDYMLGPADSLDELDLDKPETEDPTVTRQRAKALTEGVGNQYRFDA